MSDLQCPVRVHLLVDGDPAPVGERIALELDLADATPEQAVERLGEVADLYRGEAVSVVLTEPARRALAERLAGDAGARLVEGDAEGWRALG